MTNNAELEFTEVNCETRAHLTRANVHSLVLMQNCFCPIQLSLLWNAPIVKTFAKDWQSERERGGNEHSYCIKLKERDGYENHQKDRKREECQEDRE